MRFNFLFPVFLLFSLFGHTLDANNKSIGLDYLNSIREEVGLLPFRSNEALTRAAISHAKYLTRQQVNSHYETTGYKGFSGKTPSDRVIQAGYHSRVVMENISVNGRDVVAAIDNLMSAIYHRFTFLTMDKDEIGEGISMLSTRRAKVTTAYVYDLGFSGLKNICKKHFSMEAGMRYIKNICRKPSKIIPEYMYIDALNKLKKQNVKIVFYPYDTQENVSPAFFIENPHPLPGSKVSGFPVSVSFNDAYVQNVSLKSFRLFDSKGFEIKQRKILTYKNDIHDKITKHQFVFMPLKRLEYSTTYKAVFEAIVDGKKIKKTWSFRTTHPKNKMYKITKKRTILTVQKGTKILLYFEPKSKRDILKNINYKGNLHIKYIDPNTLEVTLPNKVSRKAYSISESTRKVILKIL